MEKIISGSFRETQKAGAEFAKKLLPGQIVVLSGELGAGKTTFVQGLAGELGVKDRIISPTFVLVRKHRIRQPKTEIKTIYHIDLYRLEGEFDFRSLGLEDIFSDEAAVFLIEWGERHSGLKADWEVELKVEGENAREIVIKRLGVSV
jgi:tRNA threonylcarbamoyladenosine biosynthesis protein TsaE